MITSVTGTLSVIGLDWIEVTVGGVGLRVNVPPSLIDQVGQSGERVKLFTSLQVKEDSLTLYGFPNSEGRQTFEALLGVNGVGPRLALSILSRLTPDNLALAVATEDAAGFKGVPGVGARIAQRIVMELKGKLEIEMTAASMVRPDNELIEALTALGYSMAEVMDSVASLPRDEPLSTEEKVRQALDHLAGQ
jgi:Holliday junction DNA helicase RuvA